MVSQGNRRESPCANGFPDSPQETIFRRSQRNDEVSPRCEAEGCIDETLTWVYGALFDYSPNEDQSARAAAGKAGVATLSGEKTRRLYTDSGWSDMAIYQDYAYGTSQITTGSTTNYDDLTGYGNISNLFSSSTFVQVMDERVADLVVKKVDMANEDKLLSGAQFRLYRLETVPAEAGTETEVGTNVETGTETETETSAELEAGEPETTVRKYYALDDYGSVQWVDNVDSAKIVTTGSDGLGKTFSSLKDGNYSLEEIHAPDGYNLLSAVVEVKVSGGKITLPNLESSGIRVDSGILDESAKRYIYTVTIPDSSGYELPATGGSGSAVIHMLGILVLMSAGALFYIQNRPIRNPKAPHPIK